MALLLLLLISFLALGQPWKFGGSDKGIQEALKNETSLITLLEQDRKTKDEAYGDALRHLDDMERKPTCDRTATMSLVTSCQAVGGEGEKASKDDEEVLAVVKDVYATRLALCELERAGTTSPPECNRIVDFSLKQGQVIEPKYLSQTLLEPCARALSQNPQQWTSYSNNRQNAHTTCHAARIDIEKDLMIYTAKELTNNTANINDALERTLLRYNLQLQKEEDFRKRVEAFNLQIVSELEAFNDTLSFRLDNIMAAVGQRLMKIAEEMASAYSESGTGAAVLRENLGNSSSHLENIVKLYKKMQADILNQRAEMASQERTHHEANMELAVQTKRSLEEILDVKLLELARAVALVIEKTEKTTADVDLLANDLTQLRQGLESSKQRSQLYAIQIEAQFESIHNNNERTLQQQETMKVTTEGLSSTMKEIAATAQDAAKSLKLMAPFLRLSAAILNNLTICLAIILIAAGIGLKYHDNISSNLTHWAYLACFCFAGFIILYELLLW